MVQIDIQMPSDCYSCWVRKNMGCKIANNSGWLNNKRDDNCPLKEQEAKSVESIQMDRSDKWGADLSGYCPSCKRPLKNRFNTRFCGECGQAVTWDE